MLRNILSYFLLLFHFNLFAGPRMPFVEGSAEPVDRVSVEGKGDSLPFFKLKGAFDSKKNADSYARKFVSSGCENIFENKKRRYTTAKNFLKTQRLGDEDQIWPFSRKKKKLVVTIPSKSRINKFNGTRQSKYSNKATVYYIPNKIAKQQKIVRRFKQRTFNNY